MKIKVRIKSDKEREKWLEERRKGIGGSDAGAIAGVSPWRTPLEVYFEKAEGVKKEVTSDRARFGREYFEDNAVKEFTKQTGLKTERVNAILQHDQYPWMLANIDRKIIDKEHGPGVLECKSTEVYFKDEWEEDKIPDYYLLQVQHYLAVTGWEYGYIAVFIGTGLFKYKRIERDEEIINYLIQIESDFWKRVEEKNPPEWTGKGNESDLLTIVHPIEKATDESFIMEKKDEDLCKEYLELQKIAKENEQKLKEITVKIKALLQDYSAADGLKYRILYKPSETKRIDAEKIKQAGLYDEYTKTSYSRRLLVKELKN